MYRRVIPRDLFNEGNLLKCYGQLYLELEKLGMQDDLVHTYEDGVFMVHQMQDSGALTLFNVILVVRGRSVWLTRPLNSRRPYPLYAQVDDEQIDVFNDDGTLTQEMRDFLTN